MGRPEDPQWVLLEYDSNEVLDKSLLDRHQRLMLYPAVGRMEQGSQVDIQITVGDSNVLFPMKATVLEVRTRPNGPDAPRGVTLQVIEPDTSRFERMCAFVDGMWWPTARRAHPRYLHAMRVTYLLGNEKHTGTTSDISRGGLYIRTAEALGIMDGPITVRLHHSRIKSAVELEGVIRWVDQVDNRRGMGIKFLGPEDALEKLGAVVDRIVSSTKA